MEPSNRISLGYPIQRHLQLTDLIYSSGTSHIALTSPSLVVTREQSSGPSHHPKLCCLEATNGSMAASDFPTSKQPTSRRSCDYKALCSTTPLKFRRESWANRDLSSSCHYCCE